jgi:S1-C subfamily serine protease
MRSPSKIILCAALGLSALHTAPLRADDLADQGREILKKNQRAVVTVQVVLKVSTGRGNQEAKQDITGVVVDPSGLIVLALSSADPTELNRRLYGEDYKVEAEVGDVKILLEDGTEVPAEVVLRDRDQDLAFIRPKAKPASPMPFVDLAKSAQAQVLDQVIALNRLNRAAGRAYSASVERISAVVTKPRTFYLPDTMQTATGLGSPVFAGSGGLLGVVVYRTISSKGGGNASGGYTTIILPAEDILKAAKQAPEAHGDDEKKDAPKDAPKDAKPDK